MVNSQRRCAFLAVMSALAAYSIFVAITFALFGAFWKIGDLFGVLAALPAVLIGFAWYAQLEDFGAHHRGPLLLGMGSFAFGFLAIWFATSTRLKFKQGNPPSEIEILAQAIQKTGRMALTFDWCGLGTVLAVLFGMLLTYAVVGSRLGLR
jgi:hypothetical protein